MVFEKTLPMSFNTKSHYANNSKLQKTVIVKAKPMLEDAIKDMMMCMNSNSAIPNCFTMADLGCSSGPNALIPAVNVIDVVHQTCRDNNLVVPEFQIFLNDLPENDFNYIFRLIPSLRQNLEEATGEKYTHCSIAGVPGSFYERLFPCNTLHFVHSSYSLHWLSKVPEGIADINKQNLYIGKSSPSEVSEAYAKQYEEDLRRLLRCRADELTAGGRMLVVLQGRGTPIHTETHYLIDDLTDALLQFVSEGVIKEERVNSLNVPSYTPHKDEMEKIIDMEGSFTLDRIEVIEMDWSARSKKEEDDDVFDPNRTAKFLTKTMRAVTEPMIVAHFGDSVVDPLFDRYEKLVAQRLSSNDTILKFWNLALSLTKK